MSAMALVDVAISCLDSIRQISDRIEDAIVYIDAGCAESFQFMGAFPLFLELGARAVCSLENTSSLDGVVDWSSVSVSSRNIVIMTSQLLNDAHRYILKCLSLHQGVQQCTVFTSISEGAHSAYPDSPLGPDAFQEYESLLMQDYDELLKKTKTKSQDVRWSQLSVSDAPDMEYSLNDKESLETSPTVGTEDFGKTLAISVQHFPLVVCPLSPRVFVLPSEGSVAEAYLSRQHEDSLSFGLPSLSSGLSSDNDDVPPGATLTAHFLYHLAAKMDLKLEIFSLGDLSKNIGKIMTDMSSLYDVGRRKRQAGLLLVDRTLDLLTPCCHGDSLVDRMFSSLPRKERTLPFTNIRGSHTPLKQGPSTLPRPCLDVQVPVGEVLNEDDCNIKDSQLSEGIKAFLHGWDSHCETAQKIDLVDASYKDLDEQATPFWTYQLNGSLVCTECFRGTPYMEAILDRRTKDGAVLVKKWLQEALRRENTMVNVRTRPGYATKSELHAMIKALAKSQSSLLRNKGIIQLAAATAVALDETHSARWDAFSSGEKMLNVSAGDTSQNLAAQIGDLINKSALTELQGRKREKLDSSSQGLLSFQDALLLTTVGYILAGNNFPTSGSGGPFSWQEEHFLKEAIVDVILENPSATSLKFLHGLTEELEERLNRLKKEETKEASTSDQLDIDALDEDPWEKWGEEEDEDHESKNNKDQSYDDVQLKLELQDKVDNLFKFLHKLSSLRTKNLPSTDGSFALESNVNGDPFGGKGLLYRLLTKVLSKHEVPGLEYHSSTMGRLFKSGFGRFGLGQAKPSLSDQNIILVFVVGGFNGLEVLEAQEAISESGRPDIQLVVGGTTLLTPHDMLELFLGQSSHF